MYKHCLLIFLFFVAVVQSSAQTKSAYLEQIESEEQFKLLESTPLSGKFSNVTSIKIVYNIEKDKLYFTNSKRYKYHNDFCTAILGNWQSVSHFNLYNYSENDNRDYVLGNINHYRDIDLYTFEFSPYELFSESNIEVYEMVKNKVLFREEVSLMLTSSAHISDLHAIDSLYPYITSDYIYKDLQYQALNETKSYGYLKKIAIDDLKDTYISPFDILLINGTPNDVPLCQGIITTDFQPPLSHINILSYNRGTPIMALKSAWEEIVFDNLDGELVYYEVRTDTFVLEKASSKKAEKYWQKNTPIKTIELTPNYNHKELIAVEDLGVDDVNKVGAKAANFGELDKIEEVVVPEAAFAIPFYWYKNHVASHQIDTLIQELLTDDIYATDFDSLKRQLKTIRNAIKDMPINDSLLYIVSEKIAQSECFYRMRFRSSTNAEDVQGFNGAGLYDSETGYLYNKDKSIERAIKKVWASLWSLRAYQERSYFKIDHEEVAMGILVHRSFPAEEINGVVVTKNIYRPESEGHIINLQKGEMSIVNPPFGVTSELFVLQVRNSTDVETAYADYISYSTANGSEPLLTQAELVELYKTLQAIKLHFYKKWKAQWKMPMSDFGVDIELKYDGVERQLYIKQARPY